jgi:hypothetical protein
MTQQTKRCDFCDGGFIPARRHQRFCGEVCRDRHQKKETRLAIAYFREHAPAELRSIKEKEVIAVREYEVYLLDSTSKRRIPVGKTKAKTQEAALKWAEKTYPGSCSPRCFETNTIHLCADEVSGGQG